MITICRANEVTQRVTQNNVTAILSIEHPGAEQGRGRAPRVPGVAQKILTFWDIEDENAHNGPSEAMLKSAFDFLRAHQGENIIIHCNAGKARSVGIALAWLAWQHGIEPAIDHIKAIRPQAAPNLAVIRLADRMLGFEGALTKAVETDALFTANRKQADAARKRQIERHPELIKKLYPEKSGPR